MKRTGYAGEIKKGTNLILLAQTRLFWHEMRLQANVKPRWWKPGNRANAKERKGTNK